MLNRYGINSRLVLRFLSIAIGVVALVMAFTGLVGYLYHETDSAYFFIIAGIVFFVAIILMYFATGDNSHSIRIKDSFLIIVLLYIIVPLFGMIPFYFISPIDNFTDALFESYAGFTTTGFTTLTEYHDVSKTVIFWRSVIQWIGGMGIIVFIIALFPKLGRGKALTFFSDLRDIDSNPLHHKISTTAKSVWIIYIVYSLVGIAALYLAGQDIFDAVIYSFASISTGGGVPINGNLTEHSILIKSIIMGLMLIAGLNFALFLKPFRNMNFKVGEENRAYLLIFVFALILISVVGIAHLGYSNLLLFESVFNTVSFISTTGFYSSEVFSADILFIWVLLFFLLFIGSSAGSTGGGLNVFRIVILGKILKKYIKQTIHPGLFWSIKFDSKTLTERNIHSILGLFVLYIMVFIIGAFILTLFDYNMENAFSLCAASISNTGPGVFLLDDYFSISDINIGAKYTVMLLMIAGRVELFPFIIILSGFFWRT